MTEVLAIPEVCIHLGDPSDPRASRRGLFDGIAWKVKHRRYPPEPWQKLHNAEPAIIRSGIERALATMKRWYGMGRVRSQRLPSTLRGDGDEREAGARAHARSLTAMGEARS